MSIGDQASRGAKWTAIGTGVTALISLVEISILARLLEPVDFGIVAIILVVLAIGNVFVTIGFSDVLVVKTEATQIQLSTLYWLNVLVGMVVYAALYSLAPFLHLMIARDGVETMGRVMALALLFGAFTVQFSALMRRELQLKALAIIRMAVGAACFVIVVALALIGLGVWALILAALMGQILTNVALAWYAMRNGWWPNAAFALGDVIEMVRFGIYRIGAALLNVAYTKADQLAIGGVLGPAVLGFYSVAHNLAMQPFSRINPVLTQVSFPVFSKLKDDDEALLRGYRKGLRVLMALVAPILIGLVAVAPVLVPALLGPGWEQSIVITQILAGAVLLRSAGNINIGLILAKEKYRWPFFWNLALVILIPFSVVIAAIISKSVIVVCWVVLGVQFLLFVAGYFLFARRLLGPFGVQFLSDFGRPVGTALLMACGVLWAEKNWFSGGGLVELLILVGAGGVLYVALSFITQLQHAREVLWVLRGKL